MGRRDGIIFQKISDVDLDSIKYLAMMFIHQDAENALLEHIQTRRQ
jgi:hypothetical protein